MSSIDYRIFVLGFNPYLQHLEGLSSMAELCGKSPESMPRVMAGLVSPRIFFSLFGLMEGHRDTASKIQLFFISWHARI